MSPFSAALICATVPVNVISASAAPSPVMKVNPVVPEAVLMVCARFIGNDATVAWAGASGSFERNVQIPVMGTALLEVTAEPHLGCKKFNQRFGAGALRWVNHQDHRPSRLRGVNLRVLEGGTVRVGDAITVLNGAS